MSSFFRTLVPLSLLLCACGSSSEETRALGETTTGAGTTGGGVGSAGTGGSGVTTGGGVGSTVTGGSGVTTGTSDSTTGTVTAGGGPSTGGGGGAGGSNGGGSGLLTAGTWDDNRNFDWFEAYRAALAARQVPGILPVSGADYAAAHEAAAVAAAPREKLDVSLVIDTTGSMSDEIFYLQSEFLAISRSIGTKYPNAEARWSLVVYRDVGDAYVTRGFDFSSDAQTFQTNLAAQRADGGGDLPEAPERALADVAKLGWRDGADVAKLAFWVADAPHHAENAPALAAALGAIRAKGIRVYPIASSGVDELTELTMRSAAQLTLGRYLFLTNDSGIGGDHKEPTIPCYFVTKLDGAMLRVIDIEMTGAYREPAASEILRKGGNPENGACTLDSGKVAQIF